MLSTIGFFSILGTALGIPIYIQLLAYPFKNISQRKKLLLILTIPILPFIFLSYGLFLPIRVLFRIVAYNDYRGKPKEEKKEDNTNLDLNKERQLAQQQLAELAGLRRNLYLTRKELEQTKKELNDLKSQNTFGKSKKDLPNKGNSSIRKPITKRIM